MQNQKMLAVMDEVNSAVCEREELVHCIALALLTRKNLFVLGDVGQGKSYAIDLFRQHITDIKQFDVLMSKQIDEEQLFGRLDLSSIIPGHVSKSVLDRDSSYQEMKKDLEQALDDCRNDPGNHQYFDAAQRLQEQLSVYEKSLAALYGGIPEFITDGKIPDSHIVFADEIFKANEGVLNSLLKALNERTYTNEGRTVKIPVISFFSASNEIPNFNNPEEKILKALYDRFDLKVQTRYVEDKANRIKTLKQKQSPSNNSVSSTVTLKELEAMQQEVQTVAIPDSINELMDTILCELRKKEIAVSDRTYFNFGAIVRAQAWLSGRDTVQPSDMAILKNYLWNKPEEQTVIADVIERLTKNPVGDKINELTVKAFEIRDEFDAEQDKNRALLTFKTRLLELFDETIKLKGGLDMSDAAVSSVESFICRLEDISRNAYKQTSFTYVPLEELQAYRKLGA